MRHCYLVLTILLGLAGQRAKAQATAWHPFRPGYVYSFAQYPGLATTTLVHTLRVDSAYATTAGDSVYAFNRLLRQPATSGNGSIYFKSRNNLLGARLRWHPGTHDYYLEANAQPAIGGPAAPVALWLRPRVAVGSTWVASTTPALTATLSSRVLSTVSGAADSVATITLSNGQVLLLSRSYGLVQGPQWLTLAAAGSALPKQWQQLGLPLAGPGPYDPRRLFNLNAGDEIGYTLEDAFSFGIFLCYQGYRLRRIMGRQQTNDSLLITYKEQDRVTTSSSPNCYAPVGTTLSTIRLGRWAFSLRTGASPQFPFLGLLANEYRTTPGSQIIAMGQGYLFQLTPGACLDNSQEMSFMNVYGAAEPYSPGLDALNKRETYSSSQGLGPTYFTDFYANRLAYYRHAGTTCGQPANYSGLLPARAALAAATATLHPNPATSAATLMLAAPALPGTSLMLTDALGRCVWSTTVVAGQTQLAVPLAGQAAGLYLVQLLAPAAAPLTWKLTHLQ